MIMVLMAILLLVADADAGGRRSRRRAATVYQGEILAASTIMTEVPSVAVPEQFTGKSEGSDDAIDEVNAARARRGLPAFIRDEGLTKAACEAARRRASRLLEGHLESDFDCLPQGVTAQAAGCAAWTPDWGWGSCCTYDGYTHAGAAWVMGRDGRRYMHLFVR